MSYVGVVPLSGILLLCLLSPGSTLAAEVAGEVVSVNGSVFVRPDGRAPAAGLKPARPGDPIRSGDVVNTPSNGNVKILMKDKSVLDLGPSALFKVDHFAKNGGADRQADVSMIYGTLRAAITQKIEGKGRFRVRTPAATMGVRGTEFVVKSEVRDMAQIRNALLNTGKPLSAQAAPAGQAATGKTEITVLKGQVDVRKEDLKVLGRNPASDQKVISLMAGTQLVAKEGDAAPAKVVKLDVQQLAAVSRESLVLDNTFQKAVTIDSSVVDIGAGEATRGALSNVVSAPVTGPSSFGDTGFAGTFGVTSNFENRPVNNFPVSRNLRVTVKWGSAP
ncbi:MAG: hypothetical protein A2X94_15175 [Bdellovibrionales bacterium GWB1_55_8]|nr:MAG: hypothetical protein A2X94_15175 [Bdellovibrionales bacterium GWB1_55_8]